MKTGAIGYVFLHNVSSNCKVSHRSTSSMPRKHLSTSAITIFTVHMPLLCHPLPVFQLIRCLLFRKLEIGQTFCTNPFQFPTAYSLCYRLRWRQSSLLNQQGRHLHLPAMVHHQAAHREYTTILDDIDISHLLQADSPTTSPMGSRLDLNTTHMVHHDGSIKRGRRHGGARFALPPLSSGGAAIKKRRSATPPPPPSREPVASTEVDKAKEGWHARPHQHHHSRHQHSQPFRSATEKTHIELGRKWLSSSY